jgi:hypothetical protein
MGCLPINLFAEGPSTGSRAATHVEPSLSDEALAPFTLQYTVQPGDALLTPTAGGLHGTPEFPDRAVVQAAFWEPGTVTDQTASIIPAKSGSTVTRNNDPAVDSETPGSGLFADSEGDGASEWSTTLDSAAENRVDSAIRSTGVAVIVLGLMLAGFLSWHRVRNTKLTAITETSELSERGRLPITQTCRLHLIRAGGCDVLVAVDRGAVRAMTPLPADFSQMASMPFDEPIDAPTN